MKTNKSPGYDYISFNAINNVFESIVEPLRYILITLWANEFL